MEKWKDVKGFEGLYQVSNEGRVKSLERVVIYKDGRKKVIKEKMLYAHKNTNGHLRFRLSKDGITIEIQAHRLVADTFIPNPNNYEVVHHIDHNPYNNKVENLVWMDEKEHRGMHASEKFSKTVYQYTLDKKFIAIWKSATDASKEVSGRSSHISSCCTGKRKTHKGYIWSHTPL